VRRDRDLPTLGPMTTPPRWLREHRRAVRAAASPEWLVAEVARLVELNRGATIWKGPIDWDTFGERMPDEEWEPFIAAIEEVKGRPLAR
jgi:hypothetical protein